MQTVNKSETVKAQDVEILANESLQADKSKDAAIPLKPDAPKNEVLIMGNSLCLNELLTKLKDTKSDAGRLEAICHEKGILSKRQIKGIQGTGIQFVDIAAINQLNKAGLIAGKPEKVKARIDSIKGMNMLIDALVLLGMAQRQSDY